jgi:hypothetical protein
MKNKIVKNEDVERVTIAFDKEFYTLFKEYCDKNALTYSGKMNLILGEFVVNLSKRK